MLNDIQCHAQMAKVNRIKGAPEETNHRQRTVTAALPMAIRPTRSKQMRDKRWLFTDLTVAKHDKFLRGQTLESNRSAGMEFIGTDANLGAESVLEAIGKPG